jgi:histone H1/5
MTGISNNPARVALLTEMSEQTDGGAKVWEAQSAARNGTKQALLRDGYVSIAKGGKASITSKGREAVTAHTLKAMALPIPAPEAEAPKADEAPTAKGEAAKGEAAKAKFEAARSEVVKAPKAPKARKPTKADLTAALRSEEFAQAVAAQPAANKPEVKAEPAPVQQAEQPAPEAPKPQAAQEEVLPLHRLVRILHTEYDVGALEAPAYAIIWSAEILADKTDVETAKAALAALNRKRKAAGKVQATPAEGHFLA